MIRSFPILFAPSGVFPKIALAVPNALVVFFVELLPLLLVSLWVEFYGMTHWPEKLGDFGTASVLPQPLALQYTGAQFVIFIASLLIGSTVLREVSISSETQVTWSQCFLTLCYCLTPLAFSRVLDAIPAMNTWVCWAIGSTLTARALYHGVAVLLKPEQTKGFGLFLFAFVLITFLSALGHLMGQLVLQGRLNAVLGT